MVTATPPDRFGTLDALRGIAALVVAAEHLGGRGPFFGLQFFANGMFFVDFFFALSGFVIAASYAERLQSGFPPMRFLWLRVGRVWPVHIVMLMAYLAVELLVLFTGHALTGREAFGPEREPLQFAAQVLLLQSWSISVEMVLYVIATLLWGKFRRGCLLAWLVMAVAAGVVMHLWTLEIGMYFKLARGFAGFGLGVVAYAAWQRWGHVLETAPCGAMSALELLCVIVILAAVHTAGENPVFGLYSLLFAVTVLVFAAARGLVSWLLLMRAPMFLGTISYSIYMVHTLVESGIASISAKVAGLMGLGHWFYIPQGNSRPGLLADLFSAFLLLCVIPVAWLMYRLVEAPARDWSRRVAPRIAKAR